jgi:hypothetical protein
MARRARPGGPRDGDDDGRDRGDQGHGDHDRDNGDHDRERRREHEPYDDPAEHLAIERRRFAGGLPPTPELYALAREQWYQLPGVVTRPSMDPMVGDPDSGEAKPPGPAHPDGKGPDQ